MEFLNPVCARRLRINTFAHKSNYHLRILGTVRLLNDLGASTVLLARAVASPGALAKEPCLPLLIGATASFGSLVHQASLSHARNCVACGFFPGRILRRGGPTSIATKSANIMQTFRSRT